MRLTWKTFITICLSALKPLLVLAVDAFGLGRLMVFKPIMAQTFGWLQNLWWSECVGTLRKRGGPWRWCQHWRMSPEIEGGNRSRAGEPKSKGCAIRIYKFNLTIQQLNVRCTPSIDLLWKLKICIRFLPIYNPSDLTTYYFICCRWTLRNSASLSDI